MHECNAVCFVKAPLNPFTVLTYQIAPGKRIGFRPEQIFPVWVSPKSPKDEDLAGAVHFRNLSRPLKKLEPSTKKTRALSLVVFCFEPAEPTTNPKNDKS